MGRKTFEKRRKKFERCSSACSEWKQWKLFHTPSSKLFFHNYRLAVGSLSIFLTLQFTVSSIFSNRFNENLRDSTFVQHEIRVLLRFIVWYRIDVFTWNVNPSRIPLRSSCSAIKRCARVCMCNEIRSAFALTDLHDSSGTDLLEWQYWFFMYTD